jgi:hypothetical protein
MNNENNFQNQSLKVASNLSDLAKLLLGLGVETQVRPWKETPNPFTIIVNIYNRSITMV